MNTRTLPLNTMADMTGFRIMLFGVHTNGGRLGGTTEKRLGFRRVDGKCELSCMYHRH